MLIKYITINHAYKKQYILINNSRHRDSQTYSKLYSKSQKVPSTSAMFSFMQH